MHMQFYEMLINHFIQLSIMNTDLSYFDFVYIMIFKLFNYLSRRDRIN